MGVSGTMWAAVHDCAKFWWDCVVNSLAEGSNLVFLLEVCGVLFFDRLTAKYLKHRKDWVESAGNWAKRFLYGGLLSCAFIIAPYNAYRAERDEAAKIQPVRAELKLMQEKLKDAMQEIQTLKDVPGSAKPSMFYLEKTFQERSKPPYNLHFVCKSLNGGPLFSVALKAEVISGNCKILGVDSNERDDFKTPAVPTDEGKRVETEFYLLKQLYFDIYVITDGPGTVQLSGPHFITNMIGTVVSQQKK